MDHVLVVHGFQTECNLVQGESAEVFRVVLGEVIANVAHRTTVHVLDDEKDAILVLIQVFKLDDLGDVHPRY